MSHLDPCGMIMDYVRDPYDVPCRPFADDDTEVTMRWRPASPGAEEFPAPHRFTSLFQGYFNWASPDSVGEVFKPSEYHGGLRAVNRWFNNRKALGYDVGLTPCEPLEAFSTGEKFDPDRPHATYNEDGFPTCCLHRLVPRFGVLWGMRSSVTVIPPDLPGPTCPTELTSTLDTWFQFPIEAGAEQWIGFGFTIAASDYALEVEAVDVTSNVLIEVRRIQFCADAVATTQISAMSNADSCNSAFISMAGAFQVKLKMTNLDVSGPAKEYRCKLRYGTC